MTIVLTQSQPVVMQNTVTAVGASLRVSFSSEHSLSATAEAFRHPCPAKMLVARQGERLCRRKVSNSDRLRRVV